MFLQVRLSICLLRSVEAFRQGMLRPARSEILPDLPVECAQRRLSRDFQLACAVLKDGPSCKVKVKAGA